MGRDKLKRHLQFKPVCKQFGAKSCGNPDIIHLLHEEMEALYLMDNRRLYQAEAAEQMGVSRSTFARIIKNARQKVSMMLISGADLLIEDDKKDYWVMVASMRRQTVSPGKPDAPFLMLFHVHEGKIIEEKVFENPAFAQSVRPGQVLPELCAKLEVNFFVAVSIGTGLKNAMLSKGIFCHRRKIFTKEMLFSLVV